MTTDVKVRLREKRLADAAADYAWKADAELAELDAAPPLGISFPHYLAEYLRELRHPSSERERFAIETLDGKHIGNCTYYGINRAKGEAEVGIIIGDRDYWGKGYGASAMKALTSHIFQKTNFNRLYLKTLASNIRAQKCFAKCGFVNYGHMNYDGYNFVLMEIYREPST
jgi:RimJ/RimL family protein N-acetyltransferase